MDIKLSALKRIIREAAYSHRQELAADEARQQFPGAIEAAFDEDEGIDASYVRFYLDDAGSLLMSNYEIGWIGWSRWDAADQEWYDADDIQDEEDR